MKVMRVRKLLTLTIALMGIFFSPVLAQESDDLIVQVDYATYLNPDDGSQYVEFYYCLYRHQLGFIGTDSGTTRYAGVLVTATLEDSLGNKVDSASTYFYSQVRSLEEEQESSIRLFNNLHLQITPGTYWAVISAIDDVSKKTGLTRLRVLVPSLGSGLSSSDIQLAYDIRENEEGKGTETGSRLEKQGRLLFANPSAAYQRGVDDKITFYFELYGLNDSTGDNHFTVDYSIKDGTGNLLHNYGKVKYEKPGRSAVITNALDISSLEQGEYFLAFQSEDLSEGHQAMALKRFFVIDTNAIVQAISDQDIELMSNIAYYHLSEAEKMNLEKLDNNGKRNLLRQFWRMKDDDPTDPSNAVYDEAVRRFAYAQENFSINTERDNGWKTNRGRVYITYGRYNERDEVSMTGRSYPYIKWTYYTLEGGSIFIFTDDFSAGIIDYRLVHSTHPRERYSPEWQSILAGDEVSEDWYDSRDR